MPNFGVTPQGFVRKTLQDILASFSASQRATISPTFDTGSDGVIGQLNGIYARELAIAWEQLELCYHSNDPDAAEDVLLDMVCKLTGTTRSKATPSSVTLTCNLDVGAFLEAGVTFAAVDGRSDVRWTPLANYTASTPGNQPVVFVNEKLGPIPADPGSITVIATPVAGWTSVNNVNAAALGHNADDDGTLRLRRELDLAVVGSTTIRAIRSKLAETFPNIQNIVVFKNRTDNVDADGRPPHSVEALFFDGDPPLVDNNAIAQVISDTVAAGIQTYGISSGTAVVDEEGNTETIGFSRAAVVPIYLDFVITRGPGYVGDAAVKSSVAAQANAIFGPSALVRASHVAALPFGLTGVASVTSFHIGTAPSPSGTADIPITLRQIARFDASRITITSA